MEEKIEIIKQIVKFHPGLGTDQQYSYYTGGMADTGYWRWDILVDERVETLKWFLEDLKCEEAVSKAITEKYNNMTKEEKIKEIFDRNKGDIGMINMFNELLNRGKSLTED